MRILTHFQRKWPRRFVLSMVVILGSFAVVFAGTTNLLAQNGDSSPPNKSKLGVLEQLTFGDPGPNKNEKQVAVEATITAEKGGPKGTLKVVAKIAPGWHIYSTTQKKGAALPSKMELVSSPKVELLEQPQPDKKPKQNVVPEFDVPLEEHEGTVTWTAPVRLPAETNPESLNLKLKFSGLACNDSCLPFNETVIVKLSGFNASK